MNNDLFCEINDSKEYSKNNYYKDLFKSLFKKPSFIISSIILLIIFILGFIFSLTIDENTLTSINLDKAFISPSKNFWFGTNEFGQNMFHIVLIGTFNTLKLALLATVVNIILGVILGIAWGNSNKLNAIMIFIKGVFDCIPKTFLFIIIIFALGNNFMSLLLVIILFNWISIACLIRNNLILIRNKDYTVFSKLNKTSIFKISINNYLPSLLPIIFNSVAISIPDIIALEITIHCLKFSVMENSLSLGNIIYSSISKNIYFSHPFLFTIPLTILFIINVCFFLIGKAISSASIKEGEK